MCVLRAHIKLFIFGYIFSRIEKTVNTFSILKKFFFQKWLIIVCAQGTYQQNSNKIFNSHPLSTQPATIINPPSHHLQPTNLQLIHSYQTHKQSTKFKKNKIIIIIILSKIMSSQTKTMVRWCCSVPPRFQASNAWPDRVFPGGFLVEPDETACCVWVPPELAVSATLVPRLNRAGEAKE